jgi:hypothetical protein
MTVAPPRQQPQVDVEPRVLFPEARQRRRRRYWRSGLVLALSVCLGVALSNRFGGTSRRGPASHVKAAVAAPRPSKKGSAIPRILPQRPGPLALGPNGDLYIADEARDEILARLPNGQFKVVAGTGRFGFSGDNGPATQAELGGPQGMAVAPDGTLYFADRGNNRVRTVSPDGTITTVAGDGLPVTGPGGTPVVSGTAVGTAIGAPYAVALGTNGSLFIAASDAVLELSSGDALRVLIDPQNDAGFAPTEPLNGQCEPEAIAPDALGDLYIACSDPYVLVERLPDGTLKPLGPDRPHDVAAALVEAPDGDVLAVDGFRVVQYGPAGQHIVANLLAHGLPDGEDFEPQGIAAGSTGTLYLSQDGAAGIGPSTIVERTAGGVVRSLWGEPGPANSRRGR